MTDIAMCLNANCFSAKVCFRFTARPNELRQSYMNFEPKDGAVRCDDYMPAYAAEIGKMKGEK